MGPHLGETRPHLGATRPRVGIVKLGLDAPTWQYNDKRGRVLYLLAKASSLVKQMPTRGRVAPKLDCVPPGETALPPKLDCASTQSV